MKILLSKNTKTFLAKLWLVFVILGIVGCLFYVGIKLTGPVVLGAVLAAVGVLGFLALTLWAVQWLEEGR